MREEQKSWTGNICVFEADDILSAECPRIIVKKETSNEIARGDHIHFVANYPNGKAHAINEKIFVVVRVICDDSLMNVFGLEEVAGVEVQMKETAK